MVRAYRLPQTALPRQYDIHLWARVSDPTFDGHVRIALDLRAPVDRIELHARDMTLREATLTAGGKTLRARVEPDADAEMVALVVDGTAPAGEATLDIRYEGRVQKNMEGLYLSSDGAEECLSTQCEETDARAIFPCFDEPAFKARFATTVTTTPDVTVLANGPLREVKDAEGGLKTWSFHATKPMSSYLFATTIGRLASTPERVVEGVPMRVWAMEGKEHLGGFGQDFAARLLPWYNDYFGAPYHFDKYDQVAAPSFSAGAMENSGLVIFRQQYLLHDPQSTSWRQEKIIGRIIAHEFAHMWFGNLVTMAWWDDIWLNEAFAEWMANKAVDALAPEYRTWDDFQAGKASALSADALASTHSIYTPVATPEEATELFDAITYEKGAATMRMLENFLGETPFRDGLRSYMREFAEKNAAGADLWRHLGKASGRPVEQIMTSWVAQPGHPLVGVALDASGRRLRLTQRRFFSTPDAPANDQQWQVPLVLRYEDDAGEHEARVLLTERDAGIPVEVRGDVKWLTANAGGIGFYRQDLDDALLQKLLGNLHTLTASDLTGLLEDQWGLVKSGARPIERFLDTLDAVMRLAENHTVVERVGAFLGELEDLLLDAQDDEALARYRAWIRRDLAPRLERVGYARAADEARDAGELRRALWVTVATLGEDPAAVAKGRELADTEARNPTRVDPDLAGAAVLIAARFGDRARLDQHLEVYDRRRAAKAPPSETQRPLQSLPFFRDEAAVARIVEQLEAGRLPLEAIGPLLRSMLSTRHGRVAAWEYMMRNWDDVRGRLGDMWTGFLVEQTGNLPADRRQEMVEFYDRSLQGVAQQAYKRALERLDQRAALQRRVTPGLTAWFRERAA